MFAIIYKGEVLDTADTIEEAEYITAEYNCAFRENGAVRWTGVPLEKEEEFGALFSLSTKSPRANLTKHPTIK